jgi:hypothetical protein
MRLKTWNGCRRCSTVKSKMSGTFATVLWIYFLTVVLAARVFSSWEYVAISFTLDEGDEACKDGRNELPIS